MRHDPQRFLSKSVPHFNCETVEYASRVRNESNPDIKILLPFLKKNTEESDLENFEDLIVALDACKIPERVLLTGAICKGASFFAYFGIRPVCVTTHKGS